MNVAQELTDRIHAAADYVVEHGWTQGKMKDDEGRVCATGAVMFCQPKNGDELIVRQVQRHRDRAEEWNDTDGRTADEVVASLQVGITDAELADVFGPQWSEIVGLVRRTASLTSVETRSLGAARDATWDAAWVAAPVAARGAARDAARDATWGAARDATWDATWGTAWGAARGTAWVAARDAARGLVVRDLIGKHGFTQEHYDVLTGPWRRVIGPIHGGDVVLTGTEEQNG